MLDDAAILTLPVSRRRSIDRFGRLAQRHPLGIVGAVLLLVLLSAAIFAPLLAPYNPTAAVYSVLANPSSQHLLGTDRTGRDVLSRIIWGSRTSLTIGIVAASIGVAGATMLGVIGGYYQRWPDYLIQRSGEVLAMIPDIIFLFLWVLAFGPGVATLLAALGVGGVFAGIRIIRAGVLAEKQRAYIEAARAVGVGDGRLLIRHLLPNILPLVIVSMSLRIPAVILTEASLSFLGLGIPPPTPSWGADLGGMARTYFTTQPWLALAPGLALSATVLGFSLLGDAIRDALDPRLRRR